MKNLFAYILLALFFTGLNACAKKEAPTTDVGLSQDVINQITALGFSAHEAYAADGGYIVENDIFLTDADFQSPSQVLMHNLIVGHAEQYRTFNLVTGLPRTITISYSGNIGGNTLAGIDLAIARYNAEPIGLDFVRVSSGGNINVKIVNGGGYIASAGFPSGGNPYGEVKFNRQYENWGVNTLGSVLAHEIGHCIGFRHTDWENRAFSCGGGTANEGAGSIGAVHIPGTPTAFDGDPTSWMLACIGSTTNRPFNANDKTALNFLY